MTRRTAAQTGAQAAKERRRSEQLTQARLQVKGSLSSVLTRLPVGVRKELEQRLKDHSYEDLAELVEWLAGQGYRISRVALWRYRKRRDQQMEVLAVASEQARIIAEYTDGDEGRMTEALARLVQQRLFEMLVEFSGPLATPDLARIAKTINDLGRATISQRRWTDDARRRLEEQRSEATSKVATLERKGGLTRASARAMRNVLLGIDPLGPEWEEARGEPSIEN